MSEESAALLTVVGAGLAQGSFMLPMKWARQWQWENTWLVFACTAYLICPWLLVLSTIPNAFAIYRSIEPALLLRVGLFGVGWGIGAVTFGLGVAEVGLAVGFAVILGVATCAGTLIPLVLSSPGSAWSVSGAITGLSLTVMLAGVTVCSLAGRWKEQSLAPGAKTSSYWRGIVVCVISGLLSACGNLGFFYGSGIIDQAQKMGVPAYLASNVVWALLTAFLFICNAGYALLLLRRNRTGGNFRRKGTGRNFVYGMLMGVLWMVGFALYGSGARALGPLGPSLGWAILMSTIVLTANLLGIASGEWRGAPASSRPRLVSGLVLLTAAIAGLGYANRAGH